jgi:serine protease Do
MLSHSAATRRRRTPWIATLVLVVPMLTAFWVGRTLALQEVPAPAPSWPILLQDGPVVEPLAGSQNTAETPGDVESLLEIERRVRETVLKAVPATVGLRVGGGQGSGVIVSPDGLILTAAHVSGRPGARCVVQLPDGRSLRGRTLGRIRGLDASMVQIDDPAVTEPLPYVDLGLSSDLPQGSWTVATGHPGGFQAGRPPVVRVGRINANRDDYLQSDNTLVGGDSGGPLFDLDGRLIGIHSRIGESTAANIHVPVDQFVLNWQRMVDSEDIGGFQLPEWMRRPEADDGIRLDLGPGIAALNPRRGGGERSDPGGNGPGRASDGRPGATVARVLPDSPAQDAGVRPGDRILAIDGRDVADEGEMLVLRSTLSAGDPMIYRIRRGDDLREIEITPVPAGSIGGGFQNYPGPATGPGAPYRGVLGVTLIRDRSQPDGVVIGSIVSGGPAAEAGMEPGDTILGLAGARIADGNDLARQLIRLRGGDRVEVVLREDDGGIRTTSLTLVNRGTIYGGQTP